MSSGSSSGSAVVGAAGSLLRQQRTSRTRKTSKPKQRHASGPAYTSDYVDLDRFAADASPGSASGSYNADNVDFDEFSIGACSSSHGSYAVDCVDLDQFPKAAAAAEEQERRRKGGQPYATDAVSYDSSLSPKPATSMPVNRIKRQLRKRRRKTTSRLRSGSADIGDTAASSWHPSHVAGSNEAFVVHAPPAAAASEYAYAGFDEYDELQNMAEIVPIGRDEALRLVGIDPDVGLGDSFRERQLIALARRVDRVQQRLRYVERLRYRQSARFFEDQLDASERRQKALELAILEMELALADRAKTSRAPATARSAAERSAATQRRLSRKEALDKYKTDTVDFDRFRRGGGGGGGDDDDDDEEEDDDEDYRAENVSHEDFRAVALHSDGGSSGGAYRAEGVSYDEFGLGGCASGSDSGLYRTDRVPFDEFRAAALDDSSRGYRTECVSYDDD